MRDEVEGGGWPPAPDTPLLVTPRVGHLLAPNADFMSYEGTNTWIVAEPDGEECVVIDVGTDDPTHLAAVRALAAQLDRRITQVIITHGHPDHQGGATALAAETGARVRSYDVAVEDPEDRLVDGQILVFGQATLEVLHTPGHSDDSLCFVDAAEGLVFTGDTVLGGHAGAVFGRLREYLDSLERLQRIALDIPGMRILPGHGPIVDDPLGAIDWLRNGRLRRIEEVRAVVATGVGNPDGVVDVLYPGRGEEARMPALYMVRALLDYLAEEQAGDDSGQPPAQ